MKEACYYAATYLDQIVLFDPFYLHDESALDIDNHFIGEFSFFVSILIMIDPLIENGVVTFSIPSQPVCGSCMAKLLQESHEMGSLDLSRVANDVFMQNSSITLLDIDSEKRKCRARIDGPEDFFGSTSHEIEFDKSGRILNNKEVGKK